VKTYYDRGVFIKNIDKYFGMERDGTVKFPAVLYKKGNIVCVDQLDVHGGLIKTHILLDLYPDKDLAEKSSKLLGLDIFIAVLHKKDSEYTALKLLDYKDSPYINHDFKDFDDEARLTLVRGVMSAFLFEIDLDKNVTYH
jgi:hypothetical protein